MRSKVSITKILAVVLCIITIIICFNIYFSFEDLFSEENNIKLILNVFMLLMSFISIASIHNHILNVEKSSLYDKDYKLRSMMSIPAKEGVK